MSRWGKVCVAVLVLAVWFGAGLGPLLRPLLYTLTPLQRYYLGAYMASSWKAGRVGATTEVRWVFKARPADVQLKPKPTGKHKPDLKPAPQTIPELVYFYAQERDLIALPVLDTVWNGDALPFLLSADAEREGWTGLRQSYPRTEASAKMAAFLREQYFEGESWWRYLVQPACTLAILWLLVLLTRAALGGYRDRHLWGRPLTRRELLWRWMFVPQQIQPRLPVVRPAPFQIEATAAPAPPVSSQPQAKAAFIWDESKGID